MRTVAASLCRLDTDYIDLLHWHMWGLQYAARRNPARRLAQLEDNLGVLEFTLSDVKMGRLTAVSPVPALYPHTFWNDFVRRDLISSERVHALAMREKRV